MIGLGRTALAAVLTAVIASAGSAQSVGTAPVVVQNPEVPQGRTVTEQLNQQQTAIATAQEEANTLSEAEFERRNADYRAAQEAYAAQRAAYEAELAEIRRKDAEYQAEYARWQADVAACNAGDFTRCQSSGPAPR